MLEPIFPQIVKKKSIINLSSAEYVQRMVRDNVDSCDILSLLRELVMYLEMAG